MGIKPLPAAGSREEASSRPEAPLAKEILIVAGDPDGAGGRASTRLTLRETSHRLLAGIGARSGEDAQSHQSKQEVR
jgi:hypothetical protein